MERKRVGVKAMRIVGWVNWAEADVAVAEILVADGIPVADGALGSMTGDESAFGWKAVGGGEDCGGIDGGGVGWTVGRGRVGTVWRSGSCRGVAQTCGARTDSIRRESINPSHVA